MLTNINDDERELWLEMRRPELTRKFNALVETKGIHFLPEAEANLLFFFFVNGVRYREENPAMEN